jgi:hypothetical protein
MAPMAPMAWRKFCLWREPLSKKERRSPVWGTGSTLRRYSIAGRVQPMPGWAVHAGER